MACVWLRWLLLLVVRASWDLTHGAGGPQRPGEYPIAGLFPLHNTDSPSSGLPELGACKEGKPNKHGYYLIQAMRFAVEEINNGTRDKSLLPGVTLVYRAYDLCSMSASLLATLDLLGQQYPGGAEDGRGGGGGGRGAVAVIGPDSSSYTFTPAAALGAYLVPQISYAASNELLSNKRLYPAFFRTIPSDRNQVSAMLRLLVRFRWTWIALLGSDNAYGLQGMQSLSQLAAQYDICIAYRGVIPKLGADTAGVMRDIVKGVLLADVTAIVVFSSKRKVAGFFPFVIEQNVTGKVWIGAEDWSVASLVSGIPGIHTIGTVLGVSVKNAAIPGFEKFVSQAVDDPGQCGDSSGFSDGVECLRDTDLDSMAAENFLLEKYDIILSFNVYTAVYAVAHALHRALGCDSGECQKTEVQPWQLLPWLKRVRFSVGNTSVYFDENGDPATGYDIVTWVWRGSDWSLRTVGSYSHNPSDLTIDETQIEWSSSTGAVPSSRCSPDCPAGHRKLQTGQHKCCFDCMACPAATFLNKSGSTTCQPCQHAEWAPPESEGCFNRTVVLLAWDAPLSVALLVLLALTLLLTVASGFVFLLHLDSPVVRSAGGRTCLLMLASLTAAAASALCHFGRPSRLACVLKQPLYAVAFGVCVACVTLRAFQVVCIFKMASRLPRAYDTWAKNRGPEFTILLLSVSALLISVFRVGLNPPYPSPDLAFYPDSVIIECSNTMSPGALIEVAYLSLLCALCFSFSYMGKDLPANYNEAKCVTFSLMVSVVCWISFFTVYFVSRGRFAMSMHVLAILTSVLGILGGYFLPKVYIIVLRPQLNTTAHFQNCIQMYTMNKK